MSTAPFLVTRLDGVSSEFGQNRTLSQRRGVGSRKPSFARNLVEKAERPSGNVRFGSQEPFSLGKAMNSEFREDQAASSTRISMWGRFRIRKKSYVYEK